MNARFLIFASLLPLAVATTAIANEPASVVVDCNQSRQSLSLRQVADLIGDRHFHAVSNARAVLEAEIGRVCRHSGKRQVLVQGEDPTNRRPDTRRFASRRAQR